MFSAAHIAPLKVALILIGPLQVLQGSFWNPAPGINEVQSLCTRLHHDLCFDYISWYVFYILYNISFCSNFNLIVQSDL